MSRYLLLDIDKLDMLALSYADKDSDRLEIVLDACTSLAALPPSIVVDGKVVEMEAVVTEFLNMGSSSRPGSMDWQYEPFLADMLDAAREVAE